MDHVRYNVSLCILFFVTEHLNKVGRKLKNVIKSFEMTLNSKHRAEKIKTKNQTNTNMKHQNTKDKNLVLPKTKVENADLCKPVQNEIMTTRE